MLFDKFKNKYDVQDTYFNLELNGNGVDRFFNDYIAKYKKANVYVNNYKNFSQVCEFLSKFEHSEINLILNGEKINLVKDPKSLMPGFKALSDNVKISYKKLIENDDKLISVEDTEYTSLNPWLTNLSKDDFELVSKKFGKNEQRYILMQDQIIKNVYGVLKNKYPNFDEIESHQKIDIVFDYLNSYIKKTTDSVDPIEAAVYKKGNLDSIEKLFVVLTNNRRMKLKTSYVQGKMIHGLHFYDKFDTFTGKIEGKIL